MPWQKCPICNGSGTLGAGFPSGGTCDVCLGHKIIDELSGRPPQKLLEITKLTHKLQCEHQYQGGGTAGFICGKCGMRLVCLKI